MAPIDSTISLIIQDNLESIFDNLKQAALAHRDGAIVRIDFSHIRPKGDIISSVQKPSEGVVGFLKIFDRALGTINSKTSKESPNVIVLNVDHPDILEFLSYESHFTMKISITPAFIKAVENDEMYDLIDPRTKKPVNELSARNVYDLISIKTSSNNESAIIYPEETQPVQPQTQPSKKFDKQEALPFNVSAQAEEIIPPPVATL